jgi:hypothetical protein
VPETTEAARARRRAKAEENTQQKKTGAEDMNRRGIFVRLQKRAQREEKMKQDKLGIISVKCTKQTS